MKKLLIGFLVFAVLLVGVTPAYAAEPAMEVLVRASETTVQVGDTVEFTVLATGSGVTAMQFQLLFPEGLQYVPNSGKTPENLAQKLGVPAADWTEQSKMFTFYNDIGINLTKGTEILRFSCVAQEEGDWEISLYELLPFDSNFEEFPAKLQVQRVKVVGEETDTPVSGEVLPTVPDGSLPPVSEETEPTVTTETSGPSGEAPVPEQTETAGNEEPPIPETSLQEESVQEVPASESDGPGTGTPAISWDSGILGSGGALAVGLAVVVIAIASAVVVIIMIIKKKRS